MPRRTKHTNGLMLTDAEADLLLRAKEAGQELSRASVAYENNAGYLPLTRIRQLLASLATAITTFEEERRP